MRTNTPKVPLSDIVFNNTQHLLQVSAKQVPYFTNKEFVSLKAEKPTCLTLDVSVVPEDVVVVEKNAIET
jgi:hypothetical protein